MGRRRAAGRTRGFNAAVAGRRTEAYEKGPLKVLGGEADDVAKVIEKALAARNPKPRYTVTPSARVLLGQRAVLTTACGTASWARSSRGPGD